MAAFVANDVDDRERDQVNHPGRPLPAGQVSPAFAVILFFCCLGAALFSTAYYVEPSVALWYYGFIVVGVSYRYVVEFLPGLKALYVSSAICLPVLICAISFRTDLELRRVLWATFVFSLSRELCMDLMDRGGDVKSFMHRFSPIGVAVAAFFLQALGLGLLAALAVRPARIIAFAVVSALALFSAWVWFKRRRFEIAIAAMKIQLLAGMTFLAR